MPLPILDRDSFAATNRSLPIADYFNPTLNDAFYIRRPSSRDISYYTLDTAVTIAQNLTNDSSIDELIPLLSAALSSSAHASRIACLHGLYKALPDNAKWLINFSYVSLFNDRNLRSLGFRFRIRYPIASSTFGELTFDVKSFDGYVSFDGTTYSMSDEQVHALKTAIEVGNTLSDIIVKYSEFAGSRISLADGNIFGLIHHIYRYASNAAIFYPSGNADNYPVAFDWTTPAVLKTYLENSDFRVAIAYNTNFSRLNFRASFKAGNRRSIERILNYSANVFDFLPFTIKGPKEPKATLYGVELEANGDYQPKELIDAQKDLFFIMKADGSIFGNKLNNYELVTVPASLKAHKRLWAEFFEKVDYNKFDTSKDTGNGMHVHIDAKAFTKSHLNRFTWFILNPANEDFILAISERPTKRNLDEWAGRPNLLIERSKLTAARKAAIRNANVRGAVHYKRNTTVEVRLFKGIVSYATIVKNLEFVDSIFEYTRETMLSQISLKNYFTWLQATPVNKYQMLKTFLNEIKTKELLANAEVAEYLWNTSHEGDIVEKLNKAPFKLNSGHIVYLNKKRRKKTFVFKDGKVICIKSSGGILAKLDKAIQQKQVRGAATFAVTEFAN